MRKLHLIWTLFCISAVWAQVPYAWRNNEPEAFKNWKQRMAKL